MRSNHERVAVRQERAHEREDLHAERADYIRQLEAHKWSLREDCAEYKSELHERYSIEHSVRIAELRAQLREAEAREEALKGAIMLLRPS